MMRKNGPTCVVATVAVLCLACSVQAALLYDMEGDPPPSGFGPNGLVAVTQDTIGATEGINSMKVDTGTSTFVGALTELVPAALGNPPGVDSILLDLTMDDGGGYNGDGFAGVGVTIFGFKGMTFGLPVQFAAFHAIDNTPGTTEVELSLGESVQPGPTFGKSFNQILADGDLDGLTGFQLFFNQTGDSPVVVYVDNIRSVVPEPATGMLLFVGLAAFGLKMRRRR